jgi:hypothetical protein
VVTYVGTNYNVPTLTGTFTALGSPSIIDSTRVDDQICWGSCEIANAFAVAVGGALGTPSFGIISAYFASANSGSTALVKLWAPRFCAVSAPELGATVLKLAVDW